MIETGAGTNKPPQISSFQRFGLAVQVFLLRRDWMGPASNFLMVITTQGRKSGKRFTIPVSYQRDGESIIALNPGNSNWYLNVLQNGFAILEIKRQKFEVTGKLITDEEERQRIFNIYRNGDAKVFQQIFKVSVTAPEKDLQAEFKKWNLVQFTKK